MATSTLACDEDVETDSDVVRMDHWSLLGSDESSIDILLDKLSAMSNSAPPHTIRFDVVRSKDSPRLAIVIHVHARNAPFITWDSAIRSLCLSTQLAQFDAIFPHWPGGFGSLLNAAAETRDACAPIDSCLVFLVHFYIKPDAAAGFEAAIVEEAREVRGSERGCLRFDLFRAVGPTAARAHEEGHVRYVVYEVVESLEALVEHAASPHYQKVRAALPVMQALPRSHDRGYEIVTPASLAAWQTPADPSDPRPPANLTVPHSCASLTAETGPPAGP